MKKITSLSFCLLVTFLLWPLMATAQNSQPQDRWFSCTDPATGFIYQCSVLNQAPTNQTTTTVNQTAVNQQVVVVVVPQSENQTSYNADDDTALNNNQRNSQIQRRKSSHRSAGITRNGNYSINPLRGLGGWITWSSDSEVIRVEATGDPSFRPDVWVRSTDRGYSLYYQQ